VRRNSSVTPFRFVWLHVALGGVRVGEVGLGRYLSPRGTARDLQGIAAWKGLLQFSIQLVLNSFPLLARRLFVWHGRTSTGDAGASRTLIWAASRPPLRPPRRLPPSRRREALHPASISVHEALKEVSRSGVRDLPFGIDETVREVNVDLGLS
jgi:hypothetical protein